MEAKEELERLALEFYTTINGVSYGFDLTGDALNVLKSERERQSIRRSPRRRRRSRVCGFVAPSLRRRTPASSLRTGWFVKKEIL